MLDEIGFLIYRAAGEPGAHDAVVQAAQAGPCLYRFSAFGAVSVMVRVTAVVPPDGCL
jgi:hypothetical protein